MGFFSGIKNFIKPFIAVRTWTDADHHIETGRNLKAVFKRLFTPAKAEREESFQQAMDRLDIEDKDLRTRLKEFLFLVAVFLIVAMLLFIYTVHLVMQLHFRAAAMALGATFLSLSLAIRYDFWRFQIKQQKLGCTLREWFSKGLLGRD